MEEQKKKKFIFRTTDRPDAKPEDTTPTLAYFFKLLGRKFGKLVSLNLMMLVLYIPIIASILIYFFGSALSTMQDPLYAPLLGAYLHNGSPLLSIVMGKYSEPLNIPVLTGGKIIAIGCLLGFTALTWGWQNVGATYNLRSMVRGESCFLFSDYFYAIKRNLKQAFVFGLIDFLILGVLIFDLFVSSVLFFPILAILLLYTVMRFYIYHMMITFDLPIRKLLKNAMIFTVLGIKRNLMALLGIALVIGINLAIIVPCMSVGFTVPIVLPLFYFPGLAGFIAAYAAFPNIKRYMIDTEPSNAA